MADSPTVFDPKNLFFFDSHGAARARNNPWPNKHEDEVALETARAYATTNQLDHGHLVVERAPDGKYCWAAKIRGTTRWRSPGFGLASGKFKEGDIAPFNG